MNRPRREQLEQAARLVEQARQLVDEALDGETDAFLQLRGGLRDTARGAEMENTASRLAYVFGYLDSAVAELRGVGVAA